MENYKLISWVELEKANLALWEKINKQCKGHHTRLVIGRTWFRIILEAIRFSLSFNMLFSNISSASSVISI